jgi:hypothetical protein
MKGFSPTLFCSDIGIRDDDVGCQMSDIADIKADIDAHLCQWVILKIRDLKTG